MTSLGLSRYALTMGVASALLAGCGGSQPPMTAAHGGTPQSDASTTHVPLESKATSRDLLYVATRGGIKILSYPSAKPIATLPSYASYPYVCSDPNNGNVFVTENGKIYEYKHGKTNPLAILQTPTDYSDLGGCSVDPNTGNLAVTSIFGKSHGALLLYNDATGAPNIYQDPSITNYNYCAYDDSSDIFVTGSDPSADFILTELPNGSSMFQDISLNQTFGIAEKDQWDGNYLTLRASGLHGSGAIYQVAVSGSSGTIVGTTTLKNSTGILGYWIQGDSVVAALGKPLRNKGQRLGYWRYPDGGDAEKVITGLTRGKKDHINDITISVAH